jgi:hypothetical protein
MSANTCGDQARVGLVGPGHPVTRGLRASAEAFVPLYQAVGARRIVDLDVPHLVEQRRNAGPGAVLEITA